MTNMRAIAENFILDYEPELYSQGPVYSDSGYTYEQVIQMLIKFNELNNKATNSEYASLRDLYIDSEEYNKILLDRFNKLKLTFDKVMFNDFEGIEAYNDQGIKNWYKEAEIPIPKNDRMI